MKHNDAINSNANAQFIYLAITNIRMITTNITIRVRSYVFKTIRQCLNESKHETIERQ